MSFQFFCAFVICSIFNWRTVQHFVSFKCNYVVNFVIYQFKFISTENMQMKNFPRVDTNLNNLFLISSQRVEHSSKSVHSSVPENKSLHEGMLWSIYPNRSSGVSGDELGEAAISRLRCDLLTGCWWKWLMTKQRTTPTLTPWCDGHICVTLLWPLLC